MAYHGPCMDPWVVLVVTDKLTGPFPTALRRRPRMGACALLHCPSRGQVCPFEQPHAHSRAGAWGLAPAYSRPVQCCVPHAPQCCASRSAGRCSSWGGSAPGRQRQASCACGRMLYRDSHGAQRSVPSAPVQDAIRAADRALLAFYGRGHPAAQTFFPAASYQVGCWAPRAVSV